MSVSLDGLVSAATNLASDIADSAVEAASTIVDSDATDQHNENEFIFSEMIGITVKFRAITNIGHHGDVFLVCQCDDESKQISAFKSDNGGGSTTTLNDTVSFIVKQKPSTLTFSLYEHHRLTKNKLIGTATVTLTNADTHTDNDTDSDSGNVDGSGSGSGDKSDIPVATNNATDTSATGLESSPTSSSTRRSINRRLTLSGTDITLDCTIFVNSIPHIVGRSSDELGSHTNIESLLSLIDLTIVKADGLKRERLLFKNSSFVIVNYGELSYRTQTVPHSNSPIFDQYCPIWQKRDTKDFILNFTVWQHERRKPKLIGNAFLPLKSLTLGKDYQFALPLVEDEPRTDAELNTLLATMKFDPDSATHIDTSGSKGTLIVRLTLRPRAEVERNLYDQVMATYDSDGDGKLNEAELVHLCQTIQSKLSDKEIHTAIKDTVKGTNNSAENDSDSDTEDYALDKSDLAKLFRHRCFQNKNFLLTLHAVMIHGSDALHSLMMKSFFFKQKKKSKLADSNDSDGEDDGDASDPLSTSSRDTVKIFVIDRESGMTVREEIPEYIRAAMRLMYRSRGGRLVTSRTKVQNTLRNLTIKQGTKMNSPSSAKNIPVFVKLHHINVEEVEKPLNQYTTFNEFFARRLKAGVRSCEEPKTSSIAVSPADCRLSVFDTIDDSKRLWIKGSAFSVSNVLGAADNTGELSERFNGGSLVVARLAPQDYHRWHFPVDGVSQLRTLIDGEYNTVSPIAVRKDVNVYSENHRCVCPIQTKEFGLVILVAIAASMVGSIQFVQCKCSSAEAGFNKDSDPGKVPAEINRPACADGRCMVGEQVQRFDEHGYFTFGGSTVLIFFEPSRIVFDSDLKRNSDRSIETLIKVGRRIGRATSASEL